MTGNRVAQEASRVRTVLGYVGLVLLAPITCVLLAMAFSLSAVAGRYHTSIIMAIVLVGAVWGAVQLTGCRNLRVAAVFGIVCAAGMLAGGHWIGYRADIRYGVHYVTSDTLNRFPAGVAQQSDREIYAQYVSYMLDEPTETSFWNSLRNRATIGTFEKTRRGTIDRTGFWIWLAWLLQLIVYPAAGLVAGVVCAAMRETMRQSGISSANTGLPAGAATRR